MECADSVNNPSNPVHALILDRSVRWKQLERSRKEGKAYSNSVTALAVSHCPRTSGPHQTLRGLVVVLTK
jgi:hypothetical protein